MGGHEEQNGSDSYGERPQERHVSTRQEYAIQLLLRGVKEHEVAHQVGVRRAQIRAWKENPRFRRALARARPREDNWKLAAVADFERRQRRWPTPETPWTSERKEGK
jgi:hypothetical protein